MGAFLRCTADYVSCCVNCFSACLLLQPEILKRVSQCLGKHSAEQPIRGEPQHTPGALPDGEQPERELWRSADRTPEPADPPHCLQPVTLIPCQVSSPAFCVS